MPSAPLAWFGGNFVFSLIKSTLLLVARARERVSLKGEGANNCRCNTSLVTDDLFVSVSRAQKPDRDLRKYFKVSPGFRVSLRFRLFLVSCTLILGRIAEVDVYNSQAAAAGFNIALPAAF